jgi:DNA-binding HxlR family transcriptional regulator
MAFIMQVMPPRTDFATMRCPVARTMAVVGERWSILVLREAFYGATRFDEFQRNLGIAPNILSARLRTLVQHGVLAKLPPGRGKREASAAGPDAASGAGPDAASGAGGYAITEKGRDFFPAFLALKRWGDRWMTDERGPLILLEERATGREVAALPFLASKGQPLTPDQVRIRPGPGANAALRARFATKEDQDA